MKTLLAAAVFVALTARGGLEPASRVPVLVELFTSEGCSSCPEADAVIEALQREQPVAGAEIIPISLHVDYFNHLGWKDPYSSEAFTERQVDYSRVFGPDSVYTPQMVVDGREAVAGNDGELVRGKIAAAAERSHLPLGLSAQVTAGRLHLAFQLPAAPTTDEKIFLMAALTQDGLGAAVTRGENKGRTLRHTSVARMVRRLDALGGSAASASADIALNRQWGAEGFRAVAWLQGSTSRQVYGAAAVTVTR